jgi:hypothetical protein
LIIILSHSCDVLHSSLESEPLLEVVVARPVDQEDKSLREGRHVRRFQFVSGGGTQTYEITIAEKSIIRRDILVGRSGPASGLGLELTKKLAAWTGKRYSRPAFPDEFERRLNSAKRALAKLANNAEIISGIYIWLSSFDELPADQDYRVEIIATALDTVSTNREDEQRALKFVEKMEQLILKADGIVLDNIRFVPELKFPIALIRKYRRLDFDHLSYTGDVDNTADLRSAS